MNTPDKTRWTRARRGQDPARMAGIRILTNTASAECTTSGQHRPPVWCVTRTVYFRDAQRGSEPITIGRDRACDIVIRHATVSLRHCRIETSAANTYVIEDCGSSNGVYIATYGPSDAPRRVEWERLTLGCYVYLGDVALVPVDGHGQARIAAGRMSEYLRFARAVYGTDTQIGQHLGVTGTVLQALSKCWRGLIQKPQNQNQNQANQQDQAPTAGVRSRSSA
jgi:hypothetical protein